MSDRFCSECGSPVTRAMTAPTDQMVIPKIHTKIAGVTYEVRQPRVAKLKRGDTLKLVREPGNTYDSNAISVRNSVGESLGYIPRSLAVQIAPEIDSGKQYSAIVERVTGGGIGRSYGANIRIIAYKSVYESGLGKHWEFILNGGFETLATPLPLTIVWRNELPLSRVVVAIKSSWTRLANSWSISKIKNLA